MLAEFLSQIKNAFRTKNIYKTLIYVFMTDLVLGGAGTYISYGFLSIRKILFILLVLMTFYQIVKEKRSKELLSNRTCQLLFVFFISCIVATIIGIVQNPISLVFNKLLAYSFIFCFPIYLFIYSAKRLYIRYIQSFFIYFLFFVDKQIYICYYYITFYKNIHSY